MSPLFGRLDRHLMRQAGTVLGLSAAMIVVLAIGVDFLINMGDLFKARPDEEGRGGLILELYLWRLPQLLNLALPAGMLVAALVLAAPMLRRGEFTALGACGISMQRAMRPLLVLALLVGLVDTAIADLVTPRAIARSTAIEDRLMGLRRRGRVFTVDETGSSWFTGRAALTQDPPLLDQVVVATAQRLVMAGAVAWHDGRWTASGGALSFGPDASGQLVLTRPRPLVLSDDLALPLSPTELYRRLLPSFTLTSRELLQRGDAPSQALAGGRWVRTLLPLFMVLAALPALVRFHHRSSLVTGAIKGLGAAAVPTGVLVAIVGAADATALHPFAALAIGVLGAAVPALWWWERWRL